MATVPKRADEELWYLQIVKSFALPWDEDMSVQPPAGAGELTNLGIGAEKKKRAPAANIALKKTVMTKAQSSKVKNAKGEKKGTHHSSDSWCDYVVVSDSLEGLVPAVVKKPKAEPRDTAGIPASNPDDPIDLESSPEPLVKTKTGKRKQVEIEAEAQPAKKIPGRKISKRGNLDAFIAKPPPGECLCLFYVLNVNMHFALAEKKTPVASAEPSSVVNEYLPPSPPHAPISEQLEGTKAAEDEAEKIAKTGNPEVEKSVEVESEKVVDPETVDANATHSKSPVVVARDPEKGKSVHEDPVITIHACTTTHAPVNVVKSPSDQGFSAHSEENSPIRLDETPGDYYYKFYSEKKADEIHAPVWKLRKGDTFTTGRSMHKEWAAFEASKKKATEDEARVALLRAKLEADRAKFESDQKTKEWSVAGWKRKAEAKAAILSEERKRWREICEKDKNEKMALRNIINNLKAEVERLKKQDADIEKLK
ncbi:hypothetical protein HanRHA438_Chr17g0827761 [Helianthus annuus]|nr:hypothetical protein HanRHA438_Chr17g0827761 [Helianthus annuus]